jgi:hypothetical protein
MSDPRRQALLLLFAFFLCATGCSTLPDGGADAAALRSAVTSVAPAPDGRLVRVRATSHAVVVDASTDNRAHFTPAVTVSTPGQRIIARRDDPPALAVDARGRISLVYYAVQHREALAYISYAAPGTLRFTEPVALVGPAPAEEHSMVRLAAGDDGRTWLFWYGIQRHARSGTLYAAHAAAAAPLSAPRRKLADIMCDCCRPAVAFDTRGEPVVFARMIFADGTRDHALLSVDPPRTRRAVVDDWHIDACPMQGPALSIDDANRYHLVWFTLGDRRQGLFYAYSDDRGKTFSPPLAVGDPAANARHAVVLAQAGRVVIAWEESDAGHTRLRAMQSGDRGVGWSAPQTLGSATGAAGYPEIISSAGQVLVSWPGQTDGYRLFPVGR